MATFFDLPDELMLDIVDYLRGPDDITRYQRYPDLLHLSLTSRRLRPIAQSALFEHVFLRNRFASHGLYLTALSCFLRTVLGQPDLGRKVRHLRVEFITTSTDHTVSCPISVNYCTCGWEEIMQLCSRLLSTIKTMDGAGMRNWQWSRMDVQGYPLSQLGLILMFTPELRCLAFVENEKETKLSIPMLRIESIFGTLVDSGPELNLATVPGFSKLTDLSCDRIIQPDLVAIPALRALEINLRCSEYAITQMLEEKKDTSLSTTLERLKIGLDYSVSFPGEQISVAYLQKLFAKSPCLTHFFLYCTKHDRRNTYRVLRYYRSFTALLSRVKHNNLEVLSIDTSGLGINDFHLDYYIEEAEAINESSQFPKLRHLVAPQRVFSLLGIQVVTRGARLANKTQVQSWRDSWNKF